MENIVFTQLTIPEIREILREELTKVLAENNNVNLTNKEKEEILNIKQVSELLNLAVPTLYSFTSKNILPHFKQGKKLYFKRSELLKWVEEGKIKSKAEIENDATTYINSKKRKGVK